LFDDTVRKSAEHSKTYPGSLYVDNVFFKHGRSTYFLYQRNSNKPQKKERKENVMDGISRKSGKSEHTQWRITPFGTRIVFLLDEGSSSTAPPLFHRIQEQESLGHRSSPHFPRSAKSNSSFRNRTVATTNKRSTAYSSHLMRCSTAELEEGDEEEMIHATAAERFPAPVEKNQVSARPPGIV
jgi:hypothetical protein